MCPSSIFNGDSVKILKDKLKFKTQGEIHWDSANYCPAYNTDVAGVTNQIGQEFFVKVYNPTGTTIVNGSAVYIEGVDPDGNHPAVMRAIASEYHKSRVLGIVTADIPTLQHGYVTRDGIVHDLDTSAYTEGQPIYLSPSVLGGWTGTQPNDGSFLVIIGHVIKVDATIGSIHVEHTASEYTTESTQKTGWSNDFGGATVSFTDATRTLLISPTGSEFHYYQDGIKYSKTTDSIQIPNTEGTYFFYYNMGTLTYIANGTTAQIQAIIKANATVAVLYWNATAGASVYLGPELHDLQYPPLVHLYNHKAYGARYISGLGPNTISADASGNLATSAQFGVDAGEFVDEDIQFLTPTILATTGLPIFYLAGTGASPTLRKSTNAGFSVLTAGTGRLAYNFLTGGNWTLAEVTNGKFALYHVFAINENTSIRRVISFMGQAQYATVALARTGALTEIINLQQIGVIPEEIKSIATFVYETNNTYTNAVKSRIRSYSATENFLDWRVVNTTGGTVAGGAAPSSIFADNAFQIYDDSDPTKSISFQVAGLSTGTNRTLTVPDKSITLGEILPWTTSTNYSSTATVYSPDFLLYKSTVAHTSGTFATDLGAGKWYPLGNISDDYNFIFNKNITDWISFDAYTAPESGGSATGITFVDSPSPLSSQPGVKTWRFSKDGSSRINKGKALPFSTRGEIDNYKLRNLIVEAKSSAGFVDGDVAFLLFKAGGTVPIYPADERLFASSFVSTQQYSFQLEAATDYYLLMFAKSASTTAYDVDVTMKIVESKQVNGTVDTDPTAWTPTGSLTTNVTYTGLKYRKGRFGYYEVKMLFGGVNTQGGITINMPPGEVIDSTKILLDSEAENRTLGQVEVLDAGTSQLFGKVAYNTTSNVLITVAKADGTYGTLVGVNSAANQPIAFANGDTIIAKWKVPIVGWNSTGILGQDAGQRNIVQTAQRITSSQVITSGSSTEVIFNQNYNFTGQESTGGIDYSISTGRATALESGWYDFAYTIRAYMHTTVPTEVAVYAMVNQTSIVDYESMTDLVTLKEYPFSLSGKVYLRVGEYISCIVSPTTNPTTIATGSRFFISKISSPQQIAASEKLIFESSRTVAPTGTLSAANNILKYASQKDTFNGYSASTGLYTFKENCSCWVSAHTRIAGGNTVGQLAKLSIIKNGSTVEDYDLAFMYDTAITAAMPKVNRLIDFLIGDTVGIYSFCTLNTPSIEDDIGAHGFSISKV